MQTTIRGTQTLLDQGGHLTVLLKKEKSISI